MQNFPQVGNKGEKLPNNIVFSKKILDFFLFLCVFGITLNHSAYADFDSASFTCSCITNPDDCSVNELAQLQYNVLPGNNEEEKCNQVKGCKYSVGVQAGCSVGTANYYTDYTISNCDSSTDCTTNCCVTPCPDDYPLSAAGSWTENQCYKSVNLANNQATKCRIYQSGTVMCATDNPPQSCQGSWEDTPSSNDNFCELNSAAVSNNSYATQNSTNLSAAHLEDNSVYLNTRACSLFDYRKASESSIHSASNSSSDVIITGTARWYTETGTNNASYWNVNECYKKENNENISGAYCTGVTIAHVSNDIVQNVTDVLVYYNSQSLYHNTNCPSCWRYRCTGCPEGRQFNRNVQGQYSSCQGNDVIICGCAETAQGYYSTGGDFCDYNFNETIFNGNNFADNFCPSPSENYVQPCSNPGMTSNGGATSSGQCHYGSGNGTQFCDAFGCVWLDGLSFDSTNQTYSWNGDVHLVGVSNNENADYMCPDATYTPFWGYDKDGNPIDAHGKTVNCGN